MAMVHILLEQLKARGLSIKRGDGDTLLLCGPDSERTPDVLKTVKKFKAELLEVFSGERQPVKCQQCQATVFDQKEVAKLCERRACPFKDRTRGRTSSAGGYSGSIPS